MPYDHYTPIHENLHENLSIQAVNRIGRTGEPAVAICDDLGDDVRNLRFVLSIRDMDALVADYAKWRNAQRASQTLTLARTA